VTAPGADQEVALRRPLPPLTVGRPRENERRLIRAAAKGDPDAAESLVRRHWDDLFRAAVVILQDDAAAQDVAQEAMLSALNSLKRFDRRRSLAPWLHRIAVNRAVDELRARSRRPETGTLPRELPTPQALVQGGLSPKVSSALAKLTPNDRAIVALRHLFDYRSTEIGELLDLPPGTVRRRLRDAIDAMRLELEREEA
jgi:RNA polymerase sigma-70 factor (ECF subfamily)